MLQKMVGKTMISVTETANDELRFKTDDGITFRFHHVQDCCECVHIEDICGDLADLVGSPILLADEISSDRYPAPERHDSYTWTFYKFATLQGSVTVRWLGESNGYYSESVDLQMIYI